MSLDGTEQLHFFSGESQIDAESQEINHRSSRSDLEALRMTASASETLANCGGLTSPIPSQTHDSLALVPSAIRDAERDERFLKSVTDLPNGGTLTGDSTTQR